MKQEPQPARPPAPPATKLAALRSLLTRAFIVVLAVVLGSYGIVVAVSLMLKMRR